MVISDKKVCVALPTKNEEESIRLMLGEFKKVGLDMMVIDANSADNTAKIAQRENIPVYQQGPKKGKGAGVKRAIEIADELGYEVLVLIDCDCTYPPKHIRQLLKHMPEYDIVLGARSMRDVTFLHAIVNIFHTQLINLLFNSRFRDINTGLRALKIKPFLGSLDADYFDIEADILVKAIKMKLRIKEVPISYKKRVGDSKVRARDAAIIAWRIIKERFF